MDIDASYTINPARAISETLDGETIIINLVTGSYYSLNEQGTLLWDHLRAGYTPSSICARLTELYPHEAARIESSVAACMETLLTDGLIAPLTAGVRTELPLPDATDTFVPPAIVKYDDMQEMLLADPIHDVDTSGWPAIKH